MLVDEYLDEMGKSRHQFPQSQARELVDKLSLEIASPAQQAEFEESMREFLK
jgi:hypothetical protein